MSKLIIHQIVEKDKWRSILQRLSDVLQINISMTDAKGQSFLSLNSDNYGWRLLLRSKVSDEFISSERVFLLEKFKKQGLFWEYRISPNLYIFALPITIKEGQSIGFLLVGPVFVNKRPEKSDYEQIAQKWHISLDDFNNIINEIRIVSFNGIKSIIDMLSEISRYMIQLAFENLKARSKDVSRGVKKGERDFEWSTKSHELLETLLESALKLGQAEHGSVMVLNQKSGDLTIRISRGISAKIAKNSRLKLGEGIAGLAAKENSTFIINGQQGDNRIKKYLKRPDIKHAAVIPLGVKNQVFGVLNVHTKSSGSDFQRNVDAIQQLSNLTSIAINSLQK